MYICLLLRTSEITDFRETWYIHHANTNWTNFIFSKCIPWIIPTWWSYKYSLLKFYVTRDFPKVCKYCKGNFCMLCKQYCGIFKTVHRFWFHGDNWWRIWARGFFLIIIILYGDIQGWPADHCATWKVALGSIILGKRQDEGVKHFDDCP